MLSVCSVGNTVEREQRSKAVTEVGMRVAVGQFGELTDEKLRFALQIGVTGVQRNNPKLPGERSWEEYGIRSSSIRRTPRD